MASRLLRVGLGTGFCHLVRLVMSRSPMLGHIVVVAVQDGGRQYRVAAFAGFGVCTAEPEEELPMGHSHEIVPVGGWLMERNGLKFSGHLSCDVIDCLMHLGHHDLFRALDERDGLALLGCQYWALGHRIPFRHRFCEGAGDPPDTLAPSSAPEAAYGKPDLEVVSLRGCPMPPNCCQLMPFTAGP